MKPPPDDRDRLIAGAGGDAWDHPALPQLAARTARRTRRRRQATRIGGAIALLALGAFGAWQVRRAADGITVSPPSIVQVPGTPLAPAYEIISDAQLREELAKQSVMLTERNGRIDAVIWLDR